MKELTNDLLEVEFPSGNFLKIKETLTRIGIASRRENKLYQTCHILHKRGKYYIVHFKEMFPLDGKQTDFSVDDEGRRNTIATLLQEWNLLTIKKPLLSDAPLAKLSSMKIIPFSEKSKWELVTKYNLGKKK